MRQGTHTSIAIKRWQIGEGMITKHYSSRGKRRYHAFDVSFDKNEIEKAVAFAQENPAAVRHFNGG